MSPVSSPAQHSLRPDAPGAGRALQNGESWPLHHPAVLFPLGFPNCVGGNEAQRRHPPNEHKPVTPGGAFTAPLGPLFPHSQ